MTPLKRKRAKIPFCVTSRVSTQALSAGYIIFCVLAIVADRRSRSSRVSLRSLKDRLMNLASYHLAMRQDITLLVDLSLLAQSLKLLGYFDGASRGACLCKADQRRWRGVNDGSAA